MKVFQSKRNYVYLQDGQVHKRVQDAEAAKGEAEYLRLLQAKGVAVPKVLRQSDGELILQYIGGITLPDLLCMPGAPTNWDAVAGLVCHWLQSFYRAVDHAGSGENRGDVNGRNFIIQKDKIWGVDFESRHYGPREQDAGRLLAFVQTYDTPDQRGQNTLAQGLQRRFATQMQMDIRAVFRELELELEAMRHRRP